MSGTWTPGPPTIAEFQSFLQNIVGIAPVYLPLSPIPMVVQYAYWTAIKTVNHALKIVCLYNEAVYNLGASIIVHNAQDQTGQTYFAKLRAQYNIGTNKFYLGVVSASSDEATSVSILNPDFAKTLSLSNLQQLQDPWGQQYLAWAMDMGTVWTLS